METGTEKHQARLPATQLEAQLAVVHWAARIMWRCVAVVFVMTLLGDGLTRLLRLESWAASIIVNGVFVSICSLPLLYIVILRPLATMAAEQAAAGAEARFRTIAQAMRDAITIFDARGTIRFVNRAAEGMLGYSPGALIGAKLETLMPEERREAFRSDLRAFASGGLTAFIGKGPVERVYQRKNGERFPVELTWDRLPAHDAQKEITFVVIQREITARKQAEQALRQAEEKYRGIFEEAIVGIFQTTPDGRYLSANPTMAHMYGFDSPEELMASRTDIARQAYADPERREEFKRSMEMHGEVQGFEYEVYRKDGSKVWFLENARAVRDAHGAILYYVGAVQDVTERKQAEEVLRANEKRFRELLESLPVAVRIVQKDTVVFANAADARLHGFESPQEEFAVDASTQISPQDLPRVIEYARRRIAGEPVPRCFEVRRRRRDGTEFQAELDTEKIVFNGAPAVLVAIRDLTDRKRIEMYEKLLPVCCVCGKIRDDANTEHGAGNWGRFEEYLAAHSDAQFSHTFCPQCFEDYRKKNLMS